MNNVTANGKGFNTRIRYCARMNTRESCHLFEEALCLPRFSSLRDLYGEPNTPFLSSSFLSIFLILLVPACPG